MVSEIYIAVAVVVSKFVFFSEKSRKSSLFENWKAWLNGFLVIERQQAEVRGAR